MTARRPAAAQRPPSPPGASAGGASAVGSAPRDPAVLAATGTDINSWLEAASHRADERRARLENFPVALRFLPGEVRADLLALYAAARVIDEAGDAYPGPPGARLQVLDALDRDLERLMAGRRTEIAAVSGLAAAAGRGLSAAPLRDLVEANRRDQVVSRYETFADLRDYCRLSADPIGRLVLNLLGLATAHRLRLSDQVCSAVQIAEHLQDVGEDLLAGRIYLPQESLARFEVSERTLRALASPGTAPSVPGSDRARVSMLLLTEADRARALLRAGSPLIETIPGRARLAIAGYVAGGHAALDAVIRAGANAVTASPAPRAHRVVRHTLVGLASGGAR